MPTAPSFELRAKIQDGGGDTALQTLESYLVTLGSQYMDVADEYIRQRAEQIAVSMAHRLISHYMDINMGASVMRADGIIDEYDPDIRP